MAFSMRRAPINRNSRTFNAAVCGGLLAAGLAGAALAGERPAERGDLTPGDLARVRSVTTPATDFSKPEPFETMQGGAATSRKP